MKTTTKIINAILCILLYSNVQGGNCIPGGSTVLLSRQAQIDSFPINYPGCTNIDGELIITGDDITNLNGLIYLRKVGHLTISNNPMLINLNRLTRLDTVGYLNINQNNSLTDLQGLDNLKIANSIIINNNPSLTNLIGLGSLTHANSLLEVTYNAGLTSLIGLNNLAFSEFVRILNNSSLINLNGLQHLTDVTGMEISNNARLENLYGLNNVTYTYQHNWIENNPMLTSLDGLNNLQETLTLSITGNNSLVSLAGLEKLNIVKAINIRNNLKIASLKGIDSLHKGSLHIEGNPLLTDINNINPAIVIDYIWVFNNQSLNCCYRIKQILENNPNITAQETNISSNDIGCSSEAEIRALSSTSVCCNTTITNNESICEGKHIIVNNHTYTISGTYRDTIHNANGCDSIIITHLTVNPYFQSTQTASICKGMNYTLPGGKNVNHTGTYRDTIRNVSGCDSIIKINLTVTDPVPFTQTIAICDGQSYALPSGKTVTTSGTYIDTIRKANTCDSIIITNLSVFANTYNVQLPATNTIYAGNTIELKPIDTSNTSISWHWTPSESLNCSDCENPIASPTQNTIYLLISSAQNGCEDTAMMQIIVRNQDIYIPSAFSPNGDGIHDVLDVFINNPISFNLKIFNRWGELVFESYDEQHKWNGTFKDEIAPMDTYVWYVTYTSNTTTHTKKGSVTLIR